METVVIVGAGASGMMAALCAARDKTKKVILLERQQRVGRKLLATGNGRCNLTNMNANAQHYHGEQSDFAQFALEYFTPQDTREFFSSLGLITVEEADGRVYPLSDSANSVVDVLRFALEAMHVDLRCSCCVRKISRQEERYILETENGSITADYLVMACGGAAGEKLGGVMDGYALLKPLGHKRTALYPALVQLITAPDYPRALKGVRADAALRLLAGSSLLAESTGELQFTEKGLSGPAAFDISRAAACAGKGVSVHIDFLRDFTQENILAMLHARKEAFPHLETGELFTGMLHNRLGRMLVKYAALPPSLPIASLRGDQLSQAAASCKDLVLPLLGTEGFDKAQVTAGGIKTGGIDPQTLQSWFLPRLFFCGELLDIDGDCGGFNLQWAWASGQLAGRLGA